jgi:hypothetical protein
VTVASEIAKDYYAGRLHDYTAACYAAYLTGKDTGLADPSHDELGTSVTRADLADLPPEVRAAYAYYREHVMDADIGWAHVYRVPIQGELTYAVRARTEGDDGWLESYDPDGRFLAAARTYLDLVAWGEPAALRAQVQTGAMPPELDPSKSLWKPITS